MSLEIADGSVRRSTALSGIVSGGHAVAARIRWDGLLGRWRALADREFCPWAERYVDWLRRPLGWLVVAGLASFLAGLTFAPQGFGMAGAIAAFIALGILWPWVTMRGIMCAVRFRRRRAQEDDAVDVELSVVNRWPWSAIGVTLERGFADGSVQQPAVALARVPGWSTSTFRWRFQPERRGRYPLQSPRVCCGFPFGIWWSARDVRVEGQLLVRPRLVPLSSIPVANGSRLTVAAMLNDRPGDEGDMIGVRPYRRGDSLRRIHWAQTARHDQLVVCERQATVRSAVRVWIDASPAAHRGIGRDGSWEWCLRLGASICRQFHAHHTTVECVIGRERLDIAPGAAGLDQFLDALAQLPDRPDAAESVGFDGSSVMLVVVTTDAGAERLGRLADPNQETRWVTLRSGGFEADTRRPSEEWRTPACSSWVRIDSPDRAATQLRRQWEKNCHDA